MSDNDQTKGRGNFGNEEEHRKAGEAARDSGNVNYHDIGREGGERSHKGGNSSALNEEGTQEDQAFEPGMEDEE